MEPIDRFLAHIPGRSVTRYQGIVTAAAIGSSTLAVNVNGNVIPARYASK